MKERMKKSKSYTITEAAKKLGVSRQAVHEAIQKEQLRAEKGEIVQEVWLIPESALKTYRQKYSRKRRPKKST